MEVCYEAHKGQKDHGGTPYVFHPLHLAEQMSTEDEVVTALLHDVAEDTDVTMEMLKEMGFPGRVMEALALLKHEPGTPYMAYILQLRSNPLARRVKMADLAHNSDLTRLQKVTACDRKRKLKYRIASGLLSEKLPRGRYVRVK